jgi:hypothetical protein
VRGHLHEAFVVGRRYLFRSLESDRDTIDRHRSPEGGRVMQVAREETIVMTRDRAETGLIQGRVHLERTLEELTIASRILASMPRQTAHAFGVEEAVGRLEAALETLRALG